MLIYNVADRDRERAVHDFELLQQFDQPRTPARTAKARPQHRPAFAWRVLAHAH